MNKQAFISTLRSSLPQLSPEELDDITNDFEEHFADAMAAGKSEQEICEELGDPREIARQYREGLLTSPSNVLYPQPVQQPEASTKPKATLNGAALATVIIMNLLLGLPIWISLYATLFGFWVGAGSIGVAAIVMFSVAVLQAGAIGLTLALFGLSLLSLTVLLIILMVYLTKWLSLGLVRYVRWNKRLVMGGQLA